LLNKLYIYFFSKIPFNKMVSVKRDGINILLWLSDFTSRKIFLGYKYEIKDLNFIRNNLKEDDICIDVGSNIGYFSLHFAKVIKKKGKVFSFEANKRSCLMLQLSEELNNFNNISIYNTVLADKCGEKYNLNSFSSDSTINYFTKNKNKNKDKQNYISTTLDKELLDSSLINKQIAILKIDVEGAEYNVLKGAEMIFKSEYRPKLIMLEIFIEYCKRFNSTPDNLYEFLFKL